jgi:hypothetical protein
MGDPSQRINGPNLDAFGRLRVSSPIAQFEYQNQYNKGPLVWEEQITGGGTVTHAPNRSTVVLSPGNTTIGSKVVRQTRTYFRYTPGKSLLVFLTETLGVQVSGVRKRLGYFDSDNGVFIEQSSGIVYTVLRSKSTGSVVDTKIAQSSWNLDKMDGTGPSGQVLDVTKSQIFIFDVQWLGVGSVRCAVEIGGMTYYVHEFQNANVNTGAYMTSANLPIRYEIENTGAAASIDTMEQICSTVVTEQGSIDDKGFYTHGVSSGTTATSVTTRRSVLSIRPKATFEGQINRAKIEIEDFMALVGGNNILIELVYGGTLGGSPSWTSAGTNSVIEFDIAGTTVTGGEVIQVGYIPTGQGSTRNIEGKSVSSLYPITPSIDGSVLPILSIVCTSVTGTATVNATINVREYY